MHEIVTLQFGQRANYLATHFWNIQESYFTYAPNTEPSIVDHDIHFRPGVGTDGSDTYTPRTVIYDLKGGFGTLKQHNALYDDSGSNHGRQQNTVNAWNDGGLSTMKQQPIQQIPYQRDLDAGLPTSQLRAGQVRYWSDFNRVFFHPRSIVQLNEYSLNSQLTPFENWAAGEELWRDVDREADILDRDVRLFVEECDSMQGFQVFAGTDDAWGGWTERYLDALRDDFGKKSIWVWGIEDSRQIAREKGITKQANVAKSLAGISKASSAYTRLGTVPVTLPNYIRLDAASEWECTALMATAVESVTLPTRLRRGAGRGSSMAQFEQLLDTNDGQNVWDLGLTIGVVDVIETPLEAVPAQREQPEDVEGNQDSANYDLTFTPSSTTLLPNSRAVLQSSRSRKHYFGQVDTSRKPKFETNATWPLAGLDHEEMMRRRFNEQTVIERFAIPLGFPQLDAYPSQMFGNRSQDSREISLSSGFSTVSTNRQNIIELRDLVTRFSHVIALDEREDLYNGLTEIADKYAFGWDSDDNSEDE